jgi:formate hydrogenlyase transcriptional activator
MDGDPSTEAKNDRSSVSRTDGPPLAERFQALVSVGESITSCREPEELYRRLAIELRRVVSFDLVGVVLHGRDGEQAQLLDTASMAFTVRPSVGAEDTPAGWVIASQQPLIVADTATEMRWLEVCAVARAEGLVSFCLLPLTTGTGGLMIRSARPAIRRAEPSRYYEA